MDGVMLVRGTGIILKGDCEEFKAFVLDPFVKAV
jgi:hypothetical protein